MYTIEIFISLKSPLHVGGLSPASTAAVRGMVKTRDGWPFIPASSFKGRLRHTIERLAHGLGSPACETHRKMCRKADIACPVCQIFGSPWLPGPVRFVDIELSGPPAMVEQREKIKRMGLPHPQTTERYGVGIDRRRKVAADHLLYTTELFQPGVPLTFSGPLDGTVSSKTAAWIAAGMRYLDSLGGDRSRGLGWIVGEAIVKDRAGNVVSAEDLRAELEAKS
ncbi:MAG: RAMP superfamily CRISPR-associated protein [Chloroflexota bacterium]